MKFFGLVVVLLMPGWLLCAQPASAPTNTFVQKHGQLRVKGNRIVDQNGEPVVLRGMSLYWSQWKGQFYNTNAVKWLHDDWHCNVIRAAMAVGSNGYLANPEREKAKIKTVVEAAIVEGIYVIIDWHDHNAHRNPERAEEFFEEMAKTYHQYPNVIYELWNEPLRNADWSTVIKPYHEAVIRKIRAQDQKNLIVCGTRSWSQEVVEASLDPLKFENVAYTLHFYSSTHGEALREKASTALSNGVALFVTEWGASEANGNGRFDAEATRRWWDFLEKNQISWCAWSVADLRETSAALRPGANANGGWTTNDISTAGWFIREELRAKSF